MFETRPEEALKSKNLNEVPASMEEKGKDVKVVSRFRRHADPEKDPVNGMSLDSLKESGIEQAEVIGCNLKKTGRAESLEKSFHGPKQRTWETLRYMLDGAGREDVASYQKEELDSLPWGKDDQKRILTGSDGKMRGYSSEVVDAIIHDPQMEDMTNDMAEKLAWRVKVAENMPKYLAGGSDVEMESVTHGPNQEILLSKVLKLQDQSGKEKVGFESTNEIGGMFQPAEGFEIETTIDKDGKEEKKIAVYRMESDGTTIKSRDEYDADWDKIDELAENYRKKRVERIKSEKE